MLKHRESAGRLKFHRKRAIISHYPYDLIWRRYYRTRNYIFMMRKTFQRPDLARRETWKSLGRSIFCWLRGIRYGIEFTRLQLRGVVDGYRGKMGRTVLPRPKNAEQN
jgi:hypothetical protein